MHNANQQHDHQSAYLAALEAVREIIYSRATHFSSTIPAELLPRIALDKVFDTTTIEIPFATVESASYYKRSARHFFQQVENAIDDLAAQYVAERPDGYQQALDDMKDALNSMDPASALLPMSRRFDDKLEEIRKDMAKGDGKRNLATLSESFSRAQLQDQVLNGQWRFIHYIHTDLGDHIAALQKGYSAKEVLKGAGISQIRQLKRLLFGKTPKRPKQTAPAMR